MFRTPSGQTGKSAYMYELAAIRNARRELDARMARLTTAMAEELPEDATYEMPIASKRFPDATVTANADTMRKQLAMCEIADSFGFETVSAMIRNGNLK